MLSLVVDGLKCLDLNINDSSNTTKYGLENIPKIRKYFLDYLFNYLLLPYESLSGKPTTTASNSSQPQELANLVPGAEANNSNNNEFPACMSEKVYKQFKTDVNLQDVDELEQVIRIKLLNHLLKAFFFQSKCAILKFLSLNIYKNEDVVFHFIIATSDTRYK